MIGWASFLVGVVVAQGLVSADPVQTAATSVRVERGQLVIQAGIGAVNRITVLQRSRALDVTDVAPIVPGTGCQRVTATWVSCSASGIISVFFLLGDGDDTAEFEVVIPVNGDGEGGKDTVWGGSAPDKISGGTGDDTLYGLDGDDTLYGGDDADVLFGGPDADKLYGDSASSEPGCLVPPQTCYDWLHGEDGDDYLDGGELMDYLFGGGDADELNEPTSGSNKLDGGTGDDVITGAGPGMRDMVIYGDRTSDVVVNLSGTSYDEGPVVIMPAESGGELALGERDEITGVNDIKTGTGDDALIGAGASPVLSSGPGDDQCDPDGNDGIVLVLCPAP